MNQHVNGPAPIVPARVLDVPSQTVFPTKVVTGTIIGGGQINFGPLNPNSFTTVTTNPYYAGSNLRLTSEQLRYLIDNHDFIPFVEGSKYCLFCFALDQHLTADDHVFVISED